MTENIIDKINTAYPTMSKGNKKTADYILGNFEKASFMTASKLADEVGVSESTVVRFAASIGCSGYPELQHNLQEIVKSKLTNVQRMEAASKFEGEDILSHTLNQDIEMIKKTLESVSPDTFMNAAEAISKARRIYILGVRSSASLASFASLYLGFLFDVVTLDTSSSGEMFEQMLRIDENDLILAISFPRYSSRTVNALKFAKSRGARVISVTDSELSPIAPLADYLLISQSSMVSFVDSLVSPLSLLTALIAASFKNKRDDIHKSLEELEKIWDEYGVYQTGSDK